VPYLGRGSNRTSNLRNMAHVTLYCTWRPSGLATGLHGQRYLIISCFIKIQNVLPSGASLSRLSWKKRPLKGCLNGCFVSLCSCHQSGGGELSNAAAVHLSICLSACMLVHFRAMITTEIERANQHGHLATRSGLTGGWNLFEAENLHCQYVKNQAT